MSEKVYDTVSFIEGNLARQIDYEETEVGAPVALINVENDEDNVDFFEEEMSLPTLKEHLGTHLKSLEQLRPPSGLATGIAVFDDFLLWHGIPQGELTLLHGKAGTGATSLWIETAKRVHQEKKWVAWVNSDYELLPSNLQQKGLDLSRLLVVKKPEESAQLFWILQELISSSLFELVGCHLPEGHLKMHQLQKLKKLARRHQVAFVIVSHAKRWEQNQIFSLIIDCQRDFFTVRRALHRPTPFHISGSLVYESLMSQLTTKSRTLVG
jgi:recombination protein RecA